MISRAREDSTLLKKLSERVVVEGGSGFARILGLGFDRGLTSKCLGRLGGNSPSWRNRTAFPRIAERRRCNRLAICEAECVGHKVTSSRSSSSVQRDMTGLGHPAPGAMPADSCGIILANLSARAARLKRSVEPCHSMASAAGPDPDLAL